MRLQSDLNSQQSPLALNQRPTQFIASTQVHQATAHTRGALVLPANNQVQAGIFHSTADPGYTRSYAHQQLQQQSTVPSSEQALRDNSAKPSAPHVHPLQSSTSDNAPNRNSNDSLRMDQANNNGLLRGILEGDLELALRQANSDENVFQPSAAIPTVGHSYDQWSFAYSSAPTYSDQQQEGKGQQQQVTPSTTDQSNSIVPAQNLGLASGHSFPDERNRPHENLQQTLPLNATQSDHPIELGNQVFYDGPATAPPAGDYYFSSAERAPNNEKASSNIWW